MEIIYLKGKSGTGKTITLKLLYCIFCETGIQNPVKTGFMRNTIDPIEIRKSINRLSYEKINERDESVQNLAVKFQYKWKTVLIYTCGDSATLVKKGIELAKKYQVDYYIAPTHKAFISLILKEFSNENVIFVEKDVSLQKEGYLNCNLIQAKNLFQQIEAKIGNPS